MRIEQKCINTVRVVSSEVISNANSGHTGIALSASAILFSLFKDHLHFSTSDNLFYNRDRLVISASHIAPLLYTIEHMFGFPISIEDLKNFRKYESITPAYPTYAHTPGVEITTGSVGQGIANAVGMAIASAMLAERFNVLDDPIFSHYTYAFVSDECLMEGVAQEAISLAGTLELNKLILLYDFNRMTSVGELDLINKEDVINKFKSQNWNVIFVNNGNSYKSITKAIGRAKLSKKKPTVIIFNTVLGYGSDYANKPYIFSNALKNDEAKFLRKKFMLDGEPFDISPEVLEFCKKSKIKNDEIEMNWRKKVNLYSKTNPELYKQLAVFLEIKAIDVEKIVGNKIKDKKISGRVLNNTILNLVADKMPNLVGGRVDFDNNTLAVIGENDVFGPLNRRGRNVLFGMREQAMAGVANGMSLYAGLKVFVATNLINSSNMLSSIRLSAMMKQPVIYFFTHDSILIGEEGPTKQPVEQIGALRQIPDVNVCRPCDSKELIACYNLALNEYYPACIILSKQELVEQANSEVAKAHKGAYILEKDNGKLSFVLYASGSEVELAMNVKKEFNKSGIKCAVVSFPCIEEFERQPDSYKNSTLIKNCKYKFAIEASSDNVWYKYIGEDGKVFNLNSFGKTGKGSEIYKRFGFSVMNIKKEILKICKINV